MPKPDAPCRFTAWADSQGGWSTFDTLTTRMTAHRMDLSVGIGDLVNDGSDPAAWHGSLEPAESERASTDGWRIVVHHHFLRAEPTASALVVEAVDEKGDVFDRTAAARTHVSAPVKP